MSSTTPQLFQLASMSCIFLAIKIHSPKKVTAQAIASTGSASITAKHIEAMELSIMQCLNWHLFPPTSVAFIENFGPLVKRDCHQLTASTITDALEFARFLAELSVCAYPFVSAKPSSVAIAAILYSLEYFSILEDNSDAFHALVYDTSLDMDAPEVEACGRLLRRVHQLAVTS